jgi:hypothetical protein
MFPVYAFITYLVLALLIPLCLALVPIRRKSRNPHQVQCPALGKPATVALDPWYAVKRRTSGNDELRVRECSEWSECRDCSQNCLMQIVKAA